MWHEIFAGVYFCELAIFLSFARINFCDGQIGFSPLELIFVIFRKYPVPSIDDIFVFCQVRAIEVVVKHSYPM